MKVKAICLIGVILIGLSCSKKDSDSGSGDSSSGPDAKSRNPKAAHGESSFDENGLLVATVDPSKEAKLNGPTSSTTINNASITIRPGTLAIDTSVDVFVEEGGPLKFQGVLKDLGVGGDVFAGAPVVLIYPADKAGVTKPMTLAIDLPSDASLALTGSNEKLAVLFKTITDGTYSSGIIPLSELKLNGNQVSFETTEFGAFQPVILTEVISKKIQKKSSVSNIKNINLELAIDGDGQGKALVSLRPVPRKFLLSENHEYEYFINSHTVGAYPLKGRCTELGAKIQVSGLTSFESICEKYQWGQDVDLSALKDGPLEASISMTTDYGRNDSATFAILKDTSPPAVDYKDTPKAEFTTVTSEIYFSGAYVNYEFEIISGAGTISVSPYLEGEGVSESNFWAVTNKTDKYKTNFIFYDLAENTNIKMVYFDITADDTIEDPVSPGLNANLISGTSDVYLDITSSIDGGGYAGTLIVRRKGTEVTWEPVNGKKYTKGTLVDSDHYVAALIVHGGKTDKDLIFGQQYHYAAYSFNANLDYSPIAAKSKSAVTIVKKTNTQIGWWGGHVSDVHTASNKLYTAMGNRGMFAYDISGTNATTPVLTGSFDPPGDAIRVFAAGNYAYLIQSSGTDQSVIILDISGASPQKVSEIPGQFSGLYVEGNILHLVGYIDSNHTYVAYDISNAAAPVKKGSIESLSNFTNDVIYGDTGVVYVSTSQELYRISVADITSPSITHTYAGSVNSSLPRISYDTENDKVYVTRTNSSNDGIVKLNGDDLASPVFRLPQNATSAGGVIVNEPDVFFTLNGSGKSGLYVSNLAADTDVGSILTGADGGKSLSINGDYAYIAESDLGIAIVDIRTPASLSVAGTVATIGDAQSVLVDGNTAYICDGWNGVQILDITNKSLPIWKGAYSVASGFAYKATISGNTLYVAFDAEGVHAVNVSDPENPSYDFKNDSIDDVKDVYYQDGVVYAALNSAIGTGGLKILDSTDLTESGSVASIDITRLAYATDGAAKYIYATAGSAGIKVLDVTIPASASTVATKDMSTSINDVIVDDGYIYATGSSDKLFRFDLGTSYTALATEAYSLNPSTQPKSVTKTGEYLYLASNNGITVIHANDKVISGDMTVAFSANHAVSVGDYVYVADSSAGLTIHNKID